MAHSKCYDFNPLPPCGGRPADNLALKAGVTFQSTPSVWRETTYPASRGFACAVQISIHSLRVEGDANPITSAFNRFQFQSTPSVWRETALRTALEGLVYDFNPLPPCGGRRAGYRPEDKDDEFQSTPSVWRETKTCKCSLRFSVISIHSLRVEGDSFPLASLYASGNFNPLPPCGGRLNFH